VKNSEINSKFSTSDKKNILNSKFKSKLGLKESKNIRWEIMQEFRNAYSQNRFQNKNVLTIT